MRILVVEDERALCDAVAADLELEHYAVDRCYDGTEALERLVADEYDLAVLDLNLPGMDGMEVLKGVRAHRPDLRVLVLTARSGIADRVRGLDLGANDYLVKPFALEELEARVRNLLRREFAQRPPMVACGPLELDTARRAVSADGRRLELTGKEFALLEYLMLHAGDTVSAEELMEHVWDANANPFSNSVRTHVSSLRKKIARAVGRDLIETKIGQGYRLVAGEARP